MEKAAAEGLLHRCSCSVGPTLLRNAPFTVRGRDLMDEDIVFAVLPPRTAAVDFKNHQLQPFIFFWMEVQSARPVFECNQ